MRPFGYSDLPAKRCLWRMGIAILTMGLFSLVATAQSALVGAASVIDGDTIEIHGHRVRLSGIDAPESDQLCRGSDSSQYYCGSEAADKLDRFISRRTVSCFAKDYDRYGRMVADCAVENTNLAEWLVRNGYALDWPKYSKGRFLEFQKLAEKEERGIWAGSFAPPWSFRACTRQGGKASTCSDE